MNKIKTISSLIKKKSSNYIKVSIVVFTILLMLISSISVVFANQYLQSRKDFIENDNLHLIEMSVKYNKEGFIDNMDFNDIDLLNKKISESFNVEDFDIIAEYFINFSIQDTNENSYSIKALDDKGLKKINEDFRLEEGFLYTHKKIEPKDVILDVPIVDVIEGGGIISDGKEYKVKVDTGLTETHLFNYSRVFDTDYYTNVETFKKLIEINFNTTWDDFKKGFNEDSNYYPINVVSKIFVYVNDLKNLNPIVDVIAENNFEVSYGAQIFDNINASLKLQFYIFLGLSIVILLLIILNIIFSFNLYIKLQKKDIGILKQYRYSSDDIFKIYKLNINGIFLKVMLVVLTLTLIMSLIFIDIQNIIYIIGILGLLTFIIIFTAFIVNYLILRKYTKKDVIDLLKNNREFE
ncbi:MAG: hypothetical protein ACRCZK_02760 [Oscillospiraceae bacterium]